MHCQLCLCNVLLDNHKLQDQDRDKPYGGRNSSRLAKNRVVFSYLPPLSHSGDLLPLWPFYDWDWCDQCLCHQALTLFYLCLQLWVSDLITAQIRPSQGLVMLWHGNTHLQLVNCTGLIQSRLFGLYHCHTFWNRSTKSEPPWDTILTSIDAETTQLILSSSDIHADSNYTQKLNEFQIFDWISSTFLFVKHQLLLPK